jgi:lincosamide and streptogramin A transport system ATP-binding/permease protein
MFSRGVLGKYLAKKRGFVLASHDRSFLDSCADHIIAFNRSGTEVVKGNFSSWYADKERREAGEAAQNEQLKRDIKRLEAGAKRASEWSDKIEKSKYNIDLGSGVANDKGFIGSRSAKMMKRAKSIEKRADKAVEEKSALLKDADRADSLRIEPLKYVKQRLIEARGLTLGYGEKEVFKNLSFTVENGDRIAVNGRNGSGKSSLIKLLLGENTSGGMTFAGELNIGNSLIIAYVPQNAGDLTGSMLSFAQRNGVDESLFFTILNKLGFHKSKFDDDLTALSMGQMKKIRLAAALCKKAHLYILDEPLNYVDVISRIQIEELFLTYSPTMLFVEHDRSFCEKIANKTIEL